MSIHAAVLATNLVLRAILGEVDDFVQRGKLPIGVSIDASSVEQFENRKSDVSGHVTFTNGWSFSYDPGGVNTFESPHSPLTILQRGIRIKGPTRYGVDDAVRNAREFVRRLGFQPEEVFMDLPPEKRVQEGWNGLKWVELSWKNPTMKDTSSIDLEVSLVTGEITRGFLLHPKLRNRPIPKVDGFTGGGQRVTEAKEEAKIGVALLSERPNSIVERSISSIAEFVKKLKLPFPGEISTNTLYKVEWTPFQPQESEGLRQTRLIWSGLMRFTNEWEFDVSDGQVIGFRSPDVFFFSWNVRVKDFMGKPTISQKGAERIVGGALDAIGNAAIAKLLRGKPTIGKPNLPSGMIVPRLWLEWEAITKEGVMTQVTAEVDTATQSLKSLSIFDGGLTNRYRDK